MKNGLAAVCLEVAAGSAKEGELFLDETGSTCLSGTEDGKAWVVMNDNLEIQYFLEEKDLTSWTLPITAMAMPWLWWKTEKQIPNMTIL